MSKECKEHQLNWNECGYGGGPTADVLCDICNEDIQIPIEIYKEKQPFLYNLWLKSNNNDSNSSIDD